MSETTSCWVLTDGKPGMENQCLGLAEALGLDPIDVLGNGEGAFRSVRSPIGLSATPTSVRRPPPRNDEHGDEIRDDLGV